MAHPYIKKLCFTGNFLTYKHLVKFTKWLGSNLKAHLYFKKRKFSSSFSSLKFTTWFVSNFKAHLYFEKLRFTGIFFAQQQAVTFTSSQNFYLLQDQHNTQPPL